MKFILYKNDNCWYTTFVNIDNTIRIGKKSVFKDVIKNNFEGIKKLNNNIIYKKNYIIIYDGYVLIHGIPQSVNNKQVFDFLYKTYINNKFDFNCKEIHFVFDNSKLTKIKDQIQEKRIFRTKFFKNREERDIFINNFIEWLKNKKNKSPNFKVIISGLNKKKIINNIK